MIRMIDIIFEEHYSSVVQPVLDKTEH